MSEQSASWRFHDRLIRKLDTISTLTAKEKQAIRALPYIAREFPADQDIISIGSTARECCVIIQGWACRCRTTLEGKRQIMAFHLPGDMPDQQSFYLRRMDHSIAALTPITVAFIHHRNVQELVERHDGSRALSGATPLLMLRSSVSGWSVSAAARRSARCRRPVRHGDKGAGRRPERWRHLSLDRDPE